MNDTNARTESSPDGASAARQPLATARAFGILKETAEIVAPGDRIEARFGLIQEILSEDLSYVEAELAKSSGVGERPAVDAARHLVSAGGKRVRPLVVLLSAACFGGVPAVARELSIVAELVHSATLLHDDVIDDSPERRGITAARRVWGNAVSVLAGDLLLTHALERTFSAAPAALSDLLVTLRRLVDGEIVQLRGRAELDVSEATYFQILEDKTASLFGWSARAGAISAGAGDAEKAALGRFGEKMGVAFQLVDDALDYAGSSAETGKALLSDLSEGKVTLPLVLALSRKPVLSAKLLPAKLGDRTACEELGRAVVDLGVCDDVRRRAERETERALAALDEVRACPAREMLRAMSVELTARTR